MTNIIFNKAKVSFASADIDWVSDTIKALLIRSTSAWTPDASDNWLSDFVDGGGVEIDASGYSRATLASKAVNQDDTNDRAELDAADFNFGTIVAGQTANAVLLFKDTGVTTTSALIAFIDTAVNLPIATNGGQVVFSINPEGLLQIA